MGGIMKKEYWKPVVGYEGLYEVSNFGRVKSLKFGKERILKQSKNKKTKHGYYVVCLSKNGIVKNYLVHRLVAQAFLPNPNDYKEVNHKDENPQNNIVSNLEWCDRLYNVRYGTGIERRSKTQSKPVLQYDLNGNFIKEWKSVAECGRNGFHQGNVAACCRGELKKYKKYLNKF